MPPEDPADWGYNVDRPDLRVAGESLLADLPAGVPIINASTLAGGSDDLYSVLQAVEGQAGHPACYIQLEARDYKLNAIRAYATTDWRGFSNVNRRVLGMLGAPFVNNEFSTSITAQPGFVNGAAGARDYVLSPPSSGTSHGFLPVPVTGLYFSNQGASVPLFFSGIDFKGTLQTPFGVYSTAVQAKFRRNHGVSSPLAWSGMSLWRAVPGSRVQHCRFQGFAYTLNTAPPYEKGFLDSNYGNEIVRRIHADGRIAADIDPTRPRASGGLMWNKPQTSRFEDSYLHHTRLSGWAQNTNTNDQNERCTGSRVRTSHIADITGDPYASDFGGFPGSNIEEMVGIYRYEDVDLSMNRVGSDAHLYLATPAQYNNGSGTLVLPDRPIIEVAGFRTSETAYNGCLVIGISKEPNSTGLSPAWQKVINMGINGSNLFDVRRLDGTPLTGVRASAWNSSMTPATHYIVNY